MADIFNLSDTWNDGGTVFNGIKLNVTDTASAAGSKLLDLQVGGVSQASIASGGVFRGNQATTAPTDSSVGAYALKFASDADGSEEDIRIWKGRMLFPVRSTLIPAIAIGDPGGSESDGFRGTGIGSPIGSGRVGLWATHVCRFWVSSSDVGFLSNMEIGWGPSTTAPSTSLDVTLARDAAGTLAQRNGINPQTFNIYNTYTDASNYERARIGWDADAFVIGTEAAGTGVARDIELSVEGGRNISLIADGSARLTVDRDSILARKPLQFFPDNTYDIGGTGVRPRTAYIGTTLDIAQGTLTNDAQALNISSTWDDAADTFTLIKADVTDTASAAGSKLLDLQVGGVSKFSVNSAGTTTIYGAGLVDQGLLVDRIDTRTTGFVMIGYGSGNLGTLGVHKDYLTLQGSGALKWVPSTNHQSAGDLAIYRDAANTLAQRNGVNAQTFNIYNTYTSATDFERAHIGWNDTADTFVIGTEAGSGGGVEREVHIYKGNTRCARFTGSWTFIDTANFYVSGPARFPNGVGLYGVAPPAQAAHIADATNATDVITRVNAILVALEDIGITAAS